MSAATPRTGRIEPVASSKAAAETPDQSDGKTDAGGTGIPQSNANGGLVKVATSVGIEPSKMMQGLKPGLMVKTSKGRESPFPPDPSRGNAIESGSVALQMADPRAPDFIFDGTSTSTKLQMIDLAAKLSRSGRPIRSNRGVKRHNLVDSPPLPVKKKRRRDKTKGKPGKTAVSLKKTADLDVHLEDEEPANKRTKKKKKKKKKKKNQGQKNAPSVGAQTCEHKRCNAVPCFGLRNHKVKRWCKDHHPPNAISLRTKLCEDPLCTKHATFGDPVDRKKRWCSTHKAAGAVDVKNPRCTVPDCTKQATHRGPSGRNSRGEVTYRRLLCGAHKHTILTVDGDFVCYGKAPENKGVGSSNSTGSVSAGGKKKKTGSAGTKHKKKPVGRPKKTKARSASRSFQDAGMLQESETSAASLMLAAFSQAASKGMKNELKKSSSIESPERAAFPGTPNQPTSPRSTSTMASSMLLQQQQQQQQQYFNMHYRTLSLPNGPSKKGQVVPPGLKRPLMPAMMPMTPNMTPNMMVHPRQVPGMMYSSPYYNMCSRNQPNNLYVAAAMNLSHKLRSSSTLGTTTPRSAQAVVTPRSGLSQKG